MNDSTIEAPIPFVVERLKTSDVCKKKHKPEFYIKFDGIKYGVIGSNFTLIDGFFSKTYIL